MKSFDFGRNVGLKGVEVKQGLKDYNIHIILKKNVKIQEILLNLHSTGKESLEFSLIVPTDFEYPDETLETW